MNDLTTDDFEPPQLAAIWNDTEAAGFSMPSDNATGLLLRMLAATKPSGRLLELGTGTGLSAAWLLNGMDSASTLDSVDTDPNVSAIAQQHLGMDSRLCLHVLDGAQFLAELEAECYDLIFADAWPGKYTDLELTIKTLKTGGLLVVDDMLPQSNWPDDHEPRAVALSKHLTARTDLCAVRLDWSTGLIVAAKR